MGKKSRRLSRDLQLANAAFDQISAERDEAVARCTVAKKLVVMLRENYDAREEHIRLAVAERDKAMVDMAALRRRVDSDAKLIKELREESSRLAVFENENRNLTHRVGELSRRLVSFQLHDPGDFQDTTPTGQIGQG